MRQALITTIAVLWKTWALAQVFQGFPPITPPISGNEVVPSDTGRTPPSAVISTRQLGTFGLSLDPGQNWLIAGDASQNLWQRGTSGPISEGTVMWGPDRWAYWGTSATPMVVNQDVTPGVTFPGFSAAYQMQRLSGVTGTDQICMAQEISSVNSVMLQGQYVSLDFDVYGGADFSAPRVNIYLVTGTGVDEGVTALAFGLNGGGGGSAGWTGQVNVVQAGFAPVLSGAIVQPAVVGQMPFNETEIAVVLCFTPAGTAGVNDWLDFSGIQLRQAPALALYASATNPYVSNTLPTPPFRWRLGNQEAMLQLTYFWELNEGAGVDVVGGSCRQGSTPVQADCYVPFPVVMGRVPTMSYVNGFVTDNNAGGVTPCSTLGTSTGINPTQSGVLVNCTATANVKAASFLYEHGGGGVIAADAELE